MRLKVEIHACFAVGCEDITAAVAAEFEDMINPPGRVFKDLKRSPTSLHAYQRDPSETA